jgi:hypothetical protein
MEPRYSPAAKPTALKALLTVSLGVMQHGEGLFKSMRNLIRKGCSPVRLNLNALPFAIN